MPRTGPTTNVQDVVDFQHKYGIPMSEVPRQLAPDEADFRVKFLQEELDELKLAISQGNLTKQFDALLDLVYVALGTAAMLGLPWQQGWDLVHAANMRKVRVERAEDGRHRFDVVKPAGWLPPDEDLRQLIANAAVAHARQLNFRLHEQLACDEKEHRFNPGCATCACGTFPQIDPAQDGAQLVSLGIVSEASA